MAILISPFCSSATPHHLQDFRSALSDQVHFDDVAKLAEYLGQVVLVDISAYYSIYPRSERYVRRLAGPKEAFQYPPGQVIDTH